MNIYLGQMYPLQLTIDLLNATTPICFTYIRIHIYQGPPPPIDHISIEYYYTE